MFCSDVSKDFSIELDFSFLKLINESGIGEPVLSGSSIDLDLPGSSCSSLFLFSISELEGPGMKQSFFGLAIF